MNEIKYVIVSTTVDTEGVADELSRKVIDVRLAACVQRTSVRSTYWWKDTVENADEVLLSFKTKVSLVGRLTSFIKENHSYDLPEVIVTPIMGGNDDYLNWLAETLED